MSVTNPQPPKSVAQDARLTVSLSSRRGVWLASVITLATLTTLGPISVSHAEYRGAHRYNAMGYHIAPSLNNEVYQTADDLADSARRLSRAWDEELRYNADTFTRRQKRKMGRFIDDYVEATDKLTRRLRANESDKLINRQYRDIADRGESINALSLDLHTGRQFGRALQNTEKEFINARDALDRYPDWRRHDDRYTDDRPRGKDDRRHDNRYADDRPRGRDDRRDRNSPRSAGIRVDVADRIEDLSERVKNEFRAHVKRHPEIRNQPWRSQFDGMLSQFDQTANDLQKKARAGYGQNPARELKNRARNIDRMVSDKPVGKQTRQLWTNLSRVLDKL